MISIVQGFQEVDVVATTSRSIQSVTEANGNEIVPSSLSVNTVVSVATVRGSSNTETVSS
jgi:hypothetical protein